MSTRHITLLMLCLATLCPASVLAQPAPAKPSSAQVLVARESFVAGRKHLKAGRFSKALKAFRKADEIMGLPSTRMGVADALNGLGRLVEARQAAGSVAEIPKAKGENKALLAARKDAALLVEQLDERIGRLTMAFVSEPPAKTVVELDGERVEMQRLKDMEVDPGRHTVSVAAPGKSFSEVISIREGESRTVLLSLVDNQVKSDASGAGPTVGPVAWLGIGLASAGLITGAVAGGITVSRSSELSGSCTLGDDGFGCPPELHGARADAVLSAHVSTAGFALAGGGAVLSLLGVFVIDSDGSEQPAQAIPLIGPGFVGLRGRF